MANRISDLLGTGPVVTDGAWGTELQARGLLSGDIPDLWNLTRPDLVGEVAHAYVEAGSQVILTNTFGANRLRLDAHGAAGQVEAINRRGVEISKSAAGNRARVFASMGPSGKLLMSGETTVAELTTAFAEQAQALADGGADAIVIETMSDLDEAKAALAAAKSSGLPVVVCMVFDAGKDKDRTMMGATPEVVARELTAAGADVIGANCGVGIERYVPVCQRLRAATDCPIWIKANAGLPVMEGGRVVYRTTPEEFACHVPALLAAGASFIGGCCGTSPAFIRAVCTKLPGR
ncbi:MAG: homocysteine S-methyltransferase family protein [Verrucomicrobia bacterium]|jgi:methionine synthase I (cobalamin-dependent)|nr:homocysteine S-methyltransferase family protein [Verrucomicrobiota bacterium]